MVIALPFFSVNLGHANWGTAAVVVAVGSLSLIGLGILAGVLPLLYPERGEQMSFMVQSVVLLISGVYYSIDTLPSWLRVGSHLSPATYLLRGVRHAVIDGATPASEARDIVILAVFAIVMIPLSIAVFSAAERYGKKTGRLKRQG
jgi:ABC-2 type transport system permease protein